MSDVLDTIREALEYYLTVWGARLTRGSGYEYPPYEEHKARIDAALQWVDTQRQSAGTLVEGEKEDAR